MKLTNSCGIIKTKRKGGLNMLEGFKPISLTVGLPYVSITSNGVTFNKTSIVKLGCPSHVILMINEDNKQIAIQSCNETDENATQFLKNNDKNFITVRWNNKDLLNTLSKLIGWDLSKFNYRIDGDYLSNENAMIFDLKKAVQIEKDKNL